MLSSLVNGLRKYKRDVWVIYNQDSCDKIFESYVTNKFSTSTFCFISKDYVYIIVHDLDRCNVKEFLNTQKEDLQKNNYKIKIYTYISEYELIERFDEIIYNLKYPKDILLSYSTMSDKQVDLLSHGDYIYINKLIKKVYAKYSKNFKFASAEKIIYDICSRKTDLQINRMKYLAYLTDKIFEDTFSSIKIGDTEIDINKITKEKMKLLLTLQKKQNKISKFDVAWKDAPIVLIGENLAKSGHTKPSSKVLKKGQTIYLDFGIKVEFEDGMTLYTDMQRMGYSLKDKEKGVNKSVQKVFDTLVTSIDLGIECLKPGVKAYKIDDIVRGYITKHGYPEYMHATGHPVRS